MKILTTAIILLAIPAYIFYPRQAVVEHNKFEGELIPIEVVEEIAELKVVKASYYDYRLKECNYCVWSYNHATGASRTLPHYSMARVTRVDTGKYVDVYINDWVENPNVEIDLSSFAFSQLADLSLGLIEVTVEQL